jgi:hypothetical protein
MQNVTAVTGRLEWYVWHKVTTQMINIIRNDRYGPLARIAALENVRFRGFRHDKSGRDDLDIKETKKDIQYAIRYALKSSDENVRKAAEFQAKRWDVKIFKNTTSDAKIGDEAMAPADKAALAINGGIDLSTQDAALHVEKDANGGVKVNVDPALIARIEREGMPEVVPVIINMQPADIRSLFGAGDSI